MNIKNMLDEISLEITEGLREPIPVSLIKDSEGYHGEFTIGDSSYNIVIQETSPSCFVFKFDRDGSYELTNDIKKSFQVIPTIQRVAEDFVKNKKPNMFSFFMTDGSIGRGKMYSTFTNTIGDRYGYQKYVKKYGDDITCYILFNTEVTEVDFDQLRRYVTNYI